MNWLRNFMVGRYGGDKLSMSLLIFSLLLTFIAQLTDLPLLALIAYVPLGLAIFRTLSKDIPKRSMENYKFAILISPAYAWFKQIQNRVRDAKTHRYLKCPSCRLKLRLPKGKGKIMATCPKCKTKFTIKT